MNYIPDTVGLSHDSWEISRGTLELELKLGTGCFADVFYGKKTTNFHPVGHPLEIEDLLDLLEIRRTQISDIYSSVTHSHRRIESTNPKILCDLVSVTSLLSQHEAMREDRSQTTVSPRC